MNQGDIVLVPFPYTDLSSKKTRPALIISKNNGGEDVILLAITSQVSGEGLKIDNGNLKKGYLPVVSLVKIDKVVTLRKSIIIKKVAVLKVEVVKKVVGKFKGQF